MSRSLASMVEHALDLRPDLAPHAVGISHEQAWYSIEIGSIENARASYDAGTVELCQGRFDDFYILYAIPRRQTVTRLAHERLGPWK